ncbi:MAG: ABC transporter permease subunit [Candidatus Eremiobacteraeota bacterium]|nr:ABC transporter permease subunit [Candidatus Eremiobacteraeota bacterium]
MRAVNLIARDTILELSKRKVLLAIVIAVALTVLLYVIAIAVEPSSVQKMVDRMTSGRDLSPDQVAALSMQIRKQGYGILVSVFSFVMEVLGTLIALIMFGTLIPAEIERGSIKFLISKPVSRLEVAAGKWTAGCMVLLCYSAGTSLLQALSSLYLTGGITGDTLHTFPFLFCKLLMRGSVAMCLSVAMTPVLAGVLAFFISGDIFAFLAGITGQSPLFVALSYLLPNYSAFPVHSFWNTMAHAVGASVPELSVLDIAARCAYGLFYAAAMLFLTIRQFNGKDLT